jgi:hypothetical protein
MTIKEKVRISKKSCANYNVGICLGTEMKVFGKEGRKVGIGIRINSEKSGKLCEAIIDNCEYFDYIVKPGNKE